jgi:hypothetical protein
MSFATSIGHVHLPGRRTAASPVAPAPTPDVEPRRARSGGVVDGAIADQRRELEQWSTAFTLAVGLNR